MTRRRTPAVLECFFRGPCRVTGDRRGWPIGIPVAQADRRNQGLIWTPQLVELLQTSAACDVANRLGVNRTTVSRFRRRLEIGRMTPGTTALWRELAPERLGAEARSKGGRNSRKG